MLCTWQNDCLYVHVVSYTRKHDMKRGSKHRYEHVSIHVQHISYGRSKPLPMVRDTVVAIGREHSWCGESLAFVQGILTTCLGLVEKCV